MADTGNSMKAYFLLVRLDTAIFKTGNGGAGNREIRFPILNRKRNNR